MILPHLHFPYIYMTDMIPDAIPLHKESIASTAVTAMSDKLPPAFQS